MKTLSVLEKVKQCKKIYYKQTTLFINLREEK